jgi:hypothetical protein
MCTALHQAWCQQSNQLLDSLPTKKIGRAPTPLGPGADWITPPHMPHPAFIGRAHTSTAQICHCHHSFSMSIPSQDTANLIAKLNLIIRQYRDNIWLSFEPIKPSYANHLFSTFKQFFEARHEGI